MMELFTEFFTDTAEICVFDPGCLRHRFADLPDWWTVSTEALNEMNNGNAMFVDLGDDGTYTVKIKIVEESSPNDICASSVVKCESGIIFIGPAEETTSAGCEPTDEFGGIFVKLSPQNYSIQMSRNLNSIDLSISPTSRPPENFHTRILKLN